MPKRNSSIQPTTSIDESLEPNLARAFDLVMQLMAIPGKTGQELAVADCMTQHLRDAGAPASAIKTDNAHRRTPIPGQLGNLVLRLPGTIRAPRRLLSALTLSALTITGLGACAPLMFGGAAVGVLVGLPTPPPGRTVAVAQ